MADTGFPPDDYTPHGYLANPYAVAHSWADGIEGEGGCLRTSREYLGLGWQLPWALRAKASHELMIELAGDGQRFERRADFAAAGLTSPHHSARLFVYRWEALGRVWEASYTLVEQDALGLEVTWTPVSEAPGDTLPDARLTIRLVEAGEWIDSFGRFVLWLDGTDVARTGRGSAQALARRLLDAVTVPEEISDAITTARANDDAFWNGAARLE